MKRMLAVLFFSLPAAAAEIEVKNSEFFTDPKSGLTVVRGEVSLPAREWWYLPVPAPGAQPPQTLIDPPKDEFLTMPGRRFRQAEIALKTREGRQNLQTLYWRLWTHAREHEGKLPETLEAVEKSDWWAEQVGRMKNAIHLPPHPEVRLTEANQDALREVVLAVELTPAVDDGQHWVLLGNGDTVRRPIDREAVAGWKVDIRPAAKLEDEPTPIRVTYTIYGVRVKEGQPPFTLEFRNLRGTALKAVWNTAGAKPGPAEILEKWNEMRKGTWKYWDAQAGGDGIAKAWLRMTEEEHEAANRNPWDTGSVESANVFGILGGQAALRETLQLRPIAGAAEKGEEEKLLPVADIPGVQVKSHPFEEMLKGGPGGKLELANWCPEDRLVAYFAKPKAVLPMLGQGNDFLFRMALPLTGNNISYGVKNRMLARMGISEEWIRAALATGAVKEFAVLLPDLFLIDGTDATVVLRLSNPALFAPLWKAAGGMDLSAGNIVSAPVAGGGKSHWAASGEMLVIGTHRGEVERVLELGRKNGEGSLGRSSEFRYMLTQMPVQDNTRALVYISDSFIRRLVGPEAKIGQLRRLLARRDLERITAGALLARADGQADAADLAALVKRGYVPAELQRGDYSLGADFVATSARYGTLDRPRTLLEVPLGGVTEWEASAYKGYLENYTRFWRQFFDPIAIRLDDEPDGGLALTTFILPLLDSSIFNGIRQIVADREDKKPLRLPVTTPPPVLRLSANLKEQAWQEFVNEAAPELTRKLSLPPGVFDELGPSVHFAVLDGDPVLALGSSDLLGAFGGNLERISDDEMFLIPVFASILTRPCVLMVELQDANAVVRALDSACTAPAAAQRRGELTISYYKLEGKNRWTCLVDLFGFARMRFGLEVREGMLLVDNLPWSPWPEKLGMAPALLNGMELKVDCAAARKQLPALFTSAMENYRTAAMQGMARLLPLMAGGAAEPDAALALHDRLYGFVPVHPGKGKWVMENGEWKSTSYGGFGRQTQPGHETGSRDFGVFQSIESFSVNMQFEDTGLRVKMSWK